VCLGALFAPREHPVALYSFEDFMEVRQITLNHVRTIIVHVLCLKDAFTFFTSIRPGRLAAVMAFPYSKKFMPCYSVIDDDVFAFMYHDVTSDWQASPFIASAGTAMLGKASRRITSPYAVKFSP
jgi:hypothetical protein